MLLSLHPDYVLCHTLWPQGARRTHIICEWLFDPDAIAQPDFDPSGAVEFWDMTNRQDWHVCELSQLGLGSRAYTPGPTLPPKACPLLLIGKCCGRWDRLVKSGQMLALIVSLFGSLLVSPKEFEGMLDSFSLIRIMSGSITANGVRSEFPEPTAS